MRVTADQARRMALGAQGLAARRPSNAIDVRHFRRVLTTVGAIQLDSVNVFARAHYLPFFARLGPFSLESLDRFLGRTEEVLEYWGHGASVMPISRYPLLRYRMRAVRPWGRVARLLQEEPGYVERVYRQVARSGALTVADLEDPGRRTGPWWGYGKGKTALEWLFARGRLGATRTSTFARLYDLPSRLYPRELLAARGPALDRAYEELLVLAAGHLGIGTMEDLADYYRLRLPQARRALERLVRRGRLRPAEVTGWDEVAYVHPETRLPRRVNGCRLLSPFDSMVWYRPRVERLFGFQYRIEIYVPEQKRRYGYYVLPVLLDGELVARVDLKADRAADALAVRGAFAELGRDVSAVASRLVPELRRATSWLGLRDLRVAARGNLAAELARVAR